MIACYLFYMDTYMQMDRLKLTANWVARIQKGMSLPLSSLLNLSICMLAKKKPALWNCLSLDFLDCYPRLERGARI